jgi:hypothetical protein
MQKWVWWRERQGKVWKRDSWGQGGWREQKQRKGQRGNGRRVWKSGVVQKGEVVRCRLDTKEGREGNASVGQDIQSGADMVTKMARTIGEGRKSSRLGWKEADMACAGADPAMGVDGIHVE